MPGAGTSGRRRSHRADASFGRPGDSAFEVEQINGSIGVPTLKHTALKGRKSTVNLSWTHPQSWRKLRAITLKLRTRERVVGRVDIRPRSERIAGAGAVEVVRKRSRLTGKGKTVSARLALRLHDSLAARTLSVDVEATDRRARRQLERDAGTLTIAH